MEQKIAKHIKEALQTLYLVEPDDLPVVVERTKSTFEGDYTVVVFPFVKYSRKKPDETAKEIGVYIKSRCEDIASYNVVHGFLNMRMTPDYWINKLNTLCFGPCEKPLSQDGGHTYMVEFSSPNTNKPLHLGHIRNNLLGDAVSRILEAVGNKIIRVNLVNDRGIHICKSMLAWMKWGNAATPSSTGIKGDKFVGDYYVMFEQAYKRERSELMSTGMSEAAAGEAAPLMQDARTLLRRWEQGDSEVVDIWRQMNSWVYAGFAETYKSLHITFDKVYYESETYLSGKEIVERGLAAGIFVRDADGAVWIDLTNEGLDRKILLRSDGTTVYMTQDLGTAMQRFADFSPDKIIYVVGNEQDYHFNVLKKIIAKFAPDNADKIEHLSYGMVELPSGKMKSREGTVVDADDLIAEMVQTADDIARNSGKINDLPTDERDKIIRIIALGALKYHIIKVDPKKQMVFDPAESIDFNGNTGPFIQYTYARIRSVLRNAEKMNIKFIGKVSYETQLLDAEISLLSLIYDFDDRLNEAAKKMNPGIIANYVYELAKLYNQYYHDYSILKEPDVKILQFRLLLSQEVALVIQRSMNLLGIDVPEMM